MLCCYALGQEVPQGNIESALFVEYTWGTNGYNANLKTKQEPCVKGNISFATDNKKLIKKSKMVKDFADKELVCKLLLLWPWLFRVEITNVGGSGV